MTEYDELYTASGRNLRINPPPYTVSASFRIFHDCLKDTSRMSLDETSPLIAIWKAMEMPWSPTDSKRRILFSSLLVAFLSCGCSTHAAPQKSVQTIPHADNGSAEKNFEVKWNTRIEAPGLEEHEFTELCANAVRSVLDGSTVTVSKPLELTVIDRNSQSEVGEFTMLLENAWKSCKDSPGERKSRLIPYFRNLTQYRANLDLNQSYENIVDHVVPLIRTKAYFGTNAPIELVSEPFGADLLVVYGVDSPGSFSYLTPEARLKIKLDNNQLRTKALENLDKILNKREIEVEERSGMLRVTCGGDFESSLILDRKFMKSIREKVRGTQIFGIPARHQLFITDDASAEGLDLLRKITTIGFKECDHAISDKLYKFEDDKVTFFK